MTSVHIANLALANIGANAINSFDDGTEEASYTKLVYDAFLQQIFSMGPWRFALDRARANRLYNPPVNQYRYAYAVPSGMMYVHKVFNAREEKSPSTPLLWSRIGQNIWSDYEDIIVEGTYIVNEIFWPGHFINFAYNFLATFLAMPLTKNEGVYNRVVSIALGTPSENGKGGLFRQAMSVDVQQTPQECVHHFPILIARFA